MEGHMIYRDFKGLKLSALGFGAMRLPTGASDAEIKENETEKMIDYAISHGINYFDTAWGYHDGNSETVVGKFLKKYDRGSYYIATKFPGYDLKNMGHAAEIFEKQLEKLQVGYFDFYLMHNVCELNIEQYLDPKYQDTEYMIEQRKAGKIKHLGFSAHGDMPTLKRFLEKYGNEMEFCQLQINYLDWEFQEADRKCRLLEKYNIPVWVMEPLRGGRLCDLKPYEAEAVAGIRPGISQTELAFRFIQSIPSVKVTLSGMSSLEQMKQNIEIFEEEKPLSEEEMKKLLDAAKGMVNSKTVPCTACHYCVSHCPAELDIPKLLSLYNEHYFSDGGFIAPMALESMGEDKQPSACLACGSCAAVCPQRIDIPGTLAKFAEMLEKK